MFKSLVLLALLVASAQASMVVFSNSSCQATTKVTAYSAYKSCMITDSFSYRADCDTRDYSSTRVYTVKFWSAAAACTGTPNSLAYSVVADGTCYSVSSNGVTVPNLYALATCDNFNPSPSFVNVYTSASNCGNFSSYAAPVVSSCSGYSTDAYLCHNGRLSSCADSTYTVDAADSNRCRSVKNSAGVFVQAVIGDCKSSASIVQVALPLTALLAGIIALFF